MNNERGAPYFSQSPFSGKIWLSISHTDQFVTASVILEENHEASPHRPTKALIHLGAIRQNIQQMGTHIPEGTLKWAVVKANAYGHGAVAVSKAIQDDVGWFLRFQY